MRLEQLILAMVGTRERHDRFLGSLKASTSIIPMQVQRVIGDLTQYYAEHPSVQEVDVEAFLAWARVAHKMYYAPAGTSVDDDDFIDCTRCARALGEKLPEGVEEGFAARLATESARVDVQALIGRYTSGENIDLADAIKGRMEVLDNTLGRGAVEEDDFTIEDLLAESDDNTGLHWRLSCLNRVMRPLRPGDFIILAARPDTGKTSAIASEVTHMAGQLPEGKQVLWFNNEGPRRRIVGRCWQAALGATMEELSELNQAGEMHRAYQYALGGDDKIRVIDVHSLTSAEIESIIKKSSPGLIVFDMLDNISFSGMMINGGQRTDQILETLYQWGRVLAVKHECPVIAASQVSAEGEGMQFPLLSMLKDSKTGKQGAADAIIMVGRDKDAVDVRYISTPKNKLRRSDGPGDCRAQVFFDGGRCRFYDQKPATVPAATVSPVPEPVPEPPKPIDKPLMVAPAKDV